MTAVKAVLLGWLGLLSLLLAGCGPDGAPAASVPAAAPAAQAGTWPPPKVSRQFDAGEVARGKAVYDRHCQACHGPGGRGGPGDWRERGADGRYPPPPLDDSAHAWHHPTEILRRVIKHGSPGGSGNMPAWKHVLTDAQVDEVILYIKSLWSDQVYAVWHDIERRSLEP